MIVAKRLTFHHDEGSGRSMVVNGVSGAVDLLSTEFAQRLQRLRGQELPAEARESFEGPWDDLEERGYLYASPQAEDERLQDIRARIARVRAPLTKFVLCPTYSCNLACTYCYEGDLTRKSGVVSPQQLEAAMAAIDQLKERPEVDQYLYELFGGEPLLPLTRPAVAIILEALSRQGDTLAIVTNGTHVEDFLPLFLKYPQTIESLQITLDGPRSTHDQRRIYRNGDGSFDLIVQGIDRLLQEGFMVRLRINVDRENLPQLPTLFTFIERREWNQYRNFSCDVAPVTYHTQEVDHEGVLSEDQVIGILVDEMPEILKERPYCHMGMFRVLNHVTSVLEPRRSKLKVLPSFSYCEATEASVYVFGTDGAIYTCPDSIIDRKWAVGEYWPELRLDEDKIDLWRRDIFSVPKCRECEIATFCGGGCALVPMDQGSDEPFCNGAHEALHTYLSSWFRRHPEITATV